MSSLIEILINADDNASGKMKEVAQEGDNMGKIIAGGVVAASGALPMLVGGLGAAVAMLGVVGIAAGGFAALAVPAITSVVETTDQLATIQEKMDQAKLAGDSKAYAAALKEQQMVLAQLSPEQAKAVQSLQGFKDKYQEMTTAMEPTAFNVMSQGLDLVGTTMQKLFPSFQGVGDSFAGMIQKMNEGIAAGKADAFFENINTFAVPMFEAAMQSAGNILQGFGNIMMAFTPLGLQMGDGMVDLTAKFAAWSAGLQSSQGFQQFVSFVQTSTPVVMSIIGNLWNVLVKLVTALAPLGLAVLMLAQSFLQWANESTMVQSALDGVSAAGTWMQQNLSTVQTIIVALIASFVAFKTAMAIASVIQAVTTAWGAFTTALTVVKTVLNSARLAQIGLNIAMYANPIGAVIALIVGLVAIGVLLYQNWDTIKAKAQELWAKMQEMWEGIKTSWNEGVEAVKQYFTNLWTDSVQKAEQIKTQVKAKFLEMKMQVVQTVVQLVTDAVNKFNDLKQQATDKFNQLKSDAINKFNEMKSQVVNTVNQLKSDAINKFNEIKTQVVNAVNSLKSEAVNKFNELKSQATNIVNNIKSTMVNTWNSIKSSVSSIVSSMVSQIVQFFTSMPGKIGSALSSLASLLSSTFTSALNAGKNAVTSGINSIISTIKGFIGTFTSAGKGLLDAFTNGIKSGISAAKNAVSDGMAAIRSFLPFSPAKKGPLSDLDKSGEAFFPTWYEAALTEVRGMERAVGGAFQGVASASDVALNESGLSAFSGGRTQVTVNHVVKVDGTVGLDSQGVNAFEQRVTQQVAGVVGGGMDYSGLQQSIRKL